MRLARAAALVLALAALAAAGAAVALVLLSTIGGAPESDPVGRLTPVLPGLPVTTVTIPDGGSGTQPTTPDRDADGDDD